MTDSSKSAPTGGHQFGTFGGVFTPSILTIFGLIMFMRCNYVVGTAGLVHSLFILSLCSGITLLTALSISAISTNTPVAGGGAYFLISRVMGPGFGTAIGVALFFAQALSVPFYILGFVEAFQATFTVSMSGKTMSLAVLAVLFVVAWVGADWAIRFQYVILAILVLAIGAFLIGAGLMFDPEHFQANMKPHYAPGQNMWTMFAIYFPAVTGIMAGVNMSGDLKDPARSIPSGTLAAVILSFVVYGLQIVLCGAMTDAATLREQPFRLLVVNAWLGAGALVVAGVVCATLSSAIGSNLGAPRVLQAVGRDGAIASLRPFAKGTGNAAEPRRALVLTFVIGALTLLAVGGQEGGAGLNLVASVVSMVFLYTYGMTNLAAYVESFGSNPSFRPRFHCYHWTTALLGAIACVWSAFMINVPAALLALLLLMILFVAARKRRLDDEYGDARRGYMYQRVRNNLLALTNMPVHPKNWRPTIMVFSGSPHARLSLITYARWLGARCGIVSVISVVIGELREKAEARLEEEEALVNFAKEHRLDVFTEAVVMADFDRDLPLFLQAYSMGPIKPNIVLFGWAYEAKRIRPYYRHLQTVIQMRKNVVVVVDRGLLMLTTRRRIDCWWRGQQNGSLMVILAHLLRQNHEWRGARLRLLRLVRSAEEVDNARAELAEIVQAARINAEIHIPVSTDSFDSVLRNNSSDASLVMMGFVPPESEEAEAFHQDIQQKLEEMPSTILVHSIGEADLQA